MSAGVFGVEVIRYATGNYDLDEKLPEYQARGDLEIRRAHPHGRTMMTWVWQPDGSCVQRSYGADDIIRPTHVPNVEMTLTELFPPC